MLVHTYFLNLENNTFEKSGGWRYWGKREKGLGNPVPQILYNDDILQSFTCFLCEELCLSSKKLFPCFSWGFFLCVFYTKNHHVDILLSSEYLRTVVHSLDTVLFENSCHRLLFGIKFHLCWAQMTSGHPPLLARSSALWAEATDFPTV